MLCRVTQTNINSRVPPNFDDAWHVSVGANYHINPQWMPRVGGYDQTPTNIQTEILAYQTLIVGL